MKSVKHDESLHVLVFSTSFLPFIGGAELAVNEIAKRLPEISFEVITARISRSLPAVESMGNVTVFRIGFGWSGDKFLLPVLGWRRLVLLHRRNQYKWLWSILASQASVLAALARRFLAKTNLVLTLQEGEEETHLFRYVGGNRLLYSLLVKPWHNLVFRAADSVTVISEHLRSRALKAGVDPGRIRVIPNGVDTDYFSSRRWSALAERLHRIISKQPGDVICVSTSRLVPKNGLADLVRALALMPLNYKLLIVGDGPERQNIETLIEDLNLANRVFFFGAVSYADVPAYLHASNVFIRPSLSEGFGSSFIEAMAAGVPVVGTRVGGIKDFLRHGETGWVCQPSDPKSIAEQISFITDSDNRLLVTRVIGEARRLVQNQYSWDIIAKQFAAEVFTRD